jgi:tetratricopeptide (TPR) repeat protein
MIIMKRLLLLFCLFAFGSISGRSVVDSLLTLVKPEKQDTQQVNLLVNIVKAMDNAGDARAMTYAEQALSMAGKISYNKGLADGYLAKGFCEESAGNFLKAIRDHQLAYDTYVALNDTLGQARALGNLANNEYFIGDYTASAEHSFAALGLYEQLNNTYGLIATHFAVGNVLLDQSSFGGALDQYLQAFELTKSYKDHPEYEARALVSIGNVYNYWHKDDSAAYFYIHSDSIFEKLGRPYEISVCLNNLGTIRQRQEQYEEAGSLFRRSLNIRRTMGDSDGVCSSLQNLGSLSLALHKNDSAEYFFRSALRLALLSGSSSQRVDCFKGLAETFAAIKQYDSAYYYLDRYTNLNDSIKGEESVSQVNILKQRYEDVKHQRELDQLAAQRREEKEASTQKILILFGGIVLLILVVSIVVYRNRVRRKINDELEKQNAEISAQKKHITDSIDYAKKIQDSILPPDHIVHAVIPDSFILPFLCGGLHGAWRAWRTHVRGWIQPAHPGCE